MLPINQERVLQSDEFKIWKQNFLKGFETLRIREILLDYIMEAPYVGLHNVDDVLRAHGIQQIEQKGMVKLLDHLLALGELEGGEEVASSEYSEEGI